jgi:hypothetical protein
MTVAHHAVSDEAGRTEFRTERVGTGRVDARSRTAWIRTAAGAAGAASAASAASAAA